MVLSSETFHLLVGPMISLIYALYASIRAIEGSSKESIQQCLTFWVLFTLIRLLEHMFGKLLEWLLFWPYVKVTVIFWLVLPYFGGADHVYQHYVKPCFRLNPQNLYEWLIPKNEEFIGCMSEDFLVAAERYIQENGAGALAEVISKGKSKVPNLRREDIVLSCPHSPKKAQREWTCAVCIVTTTSERDLRRHVQGKKHKAKEALMANNRKGGLGLTMQRPDIAYLVEDLNQIKEEFVRSLKRHINPFGRPLKLCTWEKPKIGWTKLNTDGCKDLKRAGMGGLLRDHLGCPTCAFVSKAPRDGIFSLEIWAIWRGLILALGQGVEAIWVESDSMSVVQAINKEWPYPMKDGSCVKRIWELLEKFDKYEVSHSWREANRAADHLAKMNLNGRDVVLWPADFPESLHIIINQDAQGKIYSRR